MMGHVDDTSARVWVKGSAPATAQLRVGTGEEMGDVIEGAEIMLGGEHDFTGTLLVEGLVANRAYLYEVLLGGSVAGKGRFRTTPAPGTPGRLRFALTSCFGKEGTDSAPGLAELVKAGPLDLVLFLGDNHYADTTGREGQAIGYASQRGTPEFLAATRSLPVYSIWDDHDFGPNDSDGTAAGKEGSLATFRDYSANPAYGEKDNPGVYFAFSRGDVDFVMLDARYHRSPDRAPDDGTKTMLGARQLAWLKQTLKGSKAKLKFVSAGSEWQMYSHLDSWTSYARERGEILDFIHDEKIEGVILLSGDRHFTGGYQVRGEVIELTAGPMGSKNFPTKNLPDMFVNEGEGKLFAVMEADTTVTPPEVAMEIYKAGAGRVWRRDFTWDEVNGRASIPKLECALANLPPVYSDDFEKGRDAWSTTDEAAWKIVETENGGHCFSLFKQSAYEPPHRSPINIAFLKDKVVGDFELKAKVKTTSRDYPHRSMCLFFGYQDPSHFYYVHLGQATDDHANQIFIVNAADRIKISETTTAGTPWDASRWHDVRIVRRVGSGRIEVYFDDMEKPAMTATDRTFGSGRVGLGSFDDEGNWDDFELRGLESGR